MLNKQIPMDLQTINNRFGIGNAPELNHAVHVAVQLAIDLGVFITRECRLGNDFFLFNNKHIDIMLAYSQ